METFIAFLVTALAVLALLAFSGVESEEEKRKREANELKKRREDAIEAARAEANSLSKRGAIFEITTTSGISGYHVRELGWVRTECEERSTAETSLRWIAAEKFIDANVLTKLSFNLRDERYQAGSGKGGNPYFRNRKIKVWEAMAGEAIPIRQVDKSPLRWNSRQSIVDGSNVANWGNSGNANLEVVKAVVLLLKKEGSRPYVVFDASIGFRVANTHMGIEEIVKAIGSDIEVEVVQSGTVADRRIIELAEERSAVIVSNDLFRDSLRARQIPKRRGFFLPQYEYAELLSPRS